ncbi:MAG: PEGA domain-containing protein [Spirochaetes bacterium]|nr:PEGA domain-containing protein [Spirochaetota bacterium]
MLKKLIYIFLALNISIFLASQTKLKNPFIDNSDDAMLRELFTANIGIMKFKKMGRLQLINPLDVQNVENAIKNVLDKIPAVKMTKKGAVLKSIDVYTKKIGATYLSHKEKAEYLQRKFFFNETLDQNLIYELFLEFRSHKDYTYIAKRWYENIENPSYSLNITAPFDRSVLNNEEICLENNLDFLISGEIEKIDKLYYINFYVYSNQLKIKILDKAFVSNSENISRNTEKEFSLILSKVFLINYASLAINTDDEETRIFFDSDYVGRKNVFIDFIIPGKYVLTLKKENFSDRAENISLFDHEKKEININIEETEALQVVNFDIEPYGTKIFINSVYQDKTPFKKALPLGNYVISAKNDLYESYRYLLNIGEVKEDEKNIVFHLKTRDIKNYFKVKKTVYYVSFWNFTFSLATMVPITVFAYDQWNRLDGAIRAQRGILNTDYGKKLELTYNILYGMAWATAVYSGLSLIWLFVSLADYIKVLEKKDFIPILEFYKNNEPDKENDSGVKVGANIRF